MFDFPQICFCVGDKCHRTYCVQAGLMAGEREGETQWQSSTFHSHVVQEIRDAVHNVVKKLARDMILWFVY